MGLIASKLAFFPSNQPGPLHADCKLIKTIHGDEIPIYFAKKTTSKFILIFSHGNADHLTNCVPFLNSISQCLNISVLGYEYVGYPHTISGNQNSSIVSNLQPSEQGCYDSIDATYEYVKKTLRYQDCYQIWMGQSIGSGPTVDLVSRLGQKNVSLAGMILISPFDSGVSIFSPFLANFYDMFGNGSKIPHVTTPTLVIHGSDDNVVPESQSKILCEKAVCDINRCVVDGADHNNLLQYRETYNLISMFVNSQTSVSELPSFEVIY